MENEPSLEVVQKALRKVLAAIEGSGFKAVAIGPMAHFAWGVKQAPSGVTLLLPTGEAQREAILGASRGEGLQQAPGGGPLNLQFTDAKLGGTATVDLLEASTPFHRKVIERAQPGDVLRIQLQTATCEDLILMLAGSTVPADRETLIELLRGHAARIDPAYIKKEAEAAGIFDKVKSAWQEAKARG